MTKITNTRIREGGSGGDLVFMLLSADIQFTGTDLTQGRSGAATFELECIVWDDDTVFNDKIARKVAPIARTTIRATTSMEIQFSLSIAKLRAAETAFERVIELFGEFKLRRNGRQIGPAVKSRNLNYRLPGGTPVPAPA